MNQPCSWATMCCKSPLVQDMLCSERQPSKTAGTLHHTAPLAPPTAPALCYGQGEEWLLS